MPLDVRFSEISSSLSRRLFKSWPLIRPNSNLPASANIGQTQSCSSFRLKWLPGTRVRKCYGCEKEITNPPQAVPDDLVVVYRDIRQYRDPNDGLVKYTNQPENVHFHLKLECIRAKYPSFVGSDLVVQQQFPPLFKLDHVQRLVGEFGWVL
jgi:hypothetical protein